jgi:hypothetical protein
MMAVADENEGFSPPTVQGLIKIENDRLLYKGKSVPVPFTRKKLIEVFGKPSREIYNAAGNVVIWDDLGLTCYGCHKQDKTPEEFQFMSKEEIKQITHQKYVDSITIFIRKYHPYPKREKYYKHEPRYPFPGKVLLDGVELDGSVTFYEFVENRKGKQSILLPENSFSFYIRCKPAPNEVTLHTIRDKYDEDFMSVYSVSIRNIGQYYKHRACTENFSVAPRPKDPDAEEEQQTRQPESDQKMPGIQIDNSEKEGAVKQETEDEKFPRVTPQAAPEPVPEKL